MLLEEWRTVSCLFGNITHLLREKSNSCPCCGFSDCNCSLDSVCGGILCWEDCRDGDRRSLAHSFTRRRSRLFVRSFARSLAFVSRSLFILRSFRAVLNRSAYHYYYQYYSYNYSYYGNCNIFQVATVATTTTTTTTKATLIRLDRGQNNSNSN